MDNYSFQQHSVYPTYYNLQQQSQPTINPVYQQQYYTNQPSPPPCLSQTLSIQGESSSKSCGVTHDFNRNGMYLISYQQIVNGNQQHRLVNPNADSIVRTDKVVNQKNNEIQICSGIVLVNSYRVIRRYDGKEEIKDVLLSFIGADSKKSEMTISYDDFRNKKKLGEVLASKNIIMHPGGKISDIMLYLQWMISIVENKIVTNDGYYFDSNGIRTNNDEWIFRNSAAPSEMLKLLGIDDKPDISASFSTLTYVLIGCISRFKQPLQIYNYETVKVIVFICSSNIRAENELRDMYCCDMNPILGADKDLQGKMYNNFVSLFQMSNETDYTVNRTLQQITSLLGKKRFDEGEYPCDTIAVMAVKNRQQIKEYMDSELVLKIPYSSCSCGTDAVRIANWFQTLYLKDKEYVPQLIKRASVYKESCLKLLGCEDHLCDTFSILMAAAEELLISAGSDDEFVRRTLDDYGDFLTGIEESNDSSAIDALREYVTDKGRDILIPKAELPKDCSKQMFIAYDESNIYLTPLVFRQIAESNQMTPKQLAQCLKDVGLLSCKDKYQKNIVFPNGQARVYDIIEDKLFEFGQIRLEPNDFADNPPALMIPIGECGGKTVYFSMSDRKGTDNGHICITGQSGSGKSFFLKNLIRNAAKQGIEVVVMGTEDTCPDFDNECSMYDFSSENLGGMTMSFHTFVSPLLQSTPMSDEAKVLAEMLDTEKSELHSVSDFIVCLRSIMENEPAAEELIDLVNKSDCFNGYTDSAYWNNVCRRGQISVVKSVDDDKTFLDSMVRSFYDFKCSQSDVTPCLLVLDECQTFDLEQGSALVDLILRRGRKHGIMAVLTSQYLTAADGRNINRAIDQCDTYIAFKPGNTPEVAKRIGINVKDSETRSAMANISKYNCIAQGKLSTDHCMIDYPLIIHVPK